MPQGLKIEREVTFMILRQTSMPVLVSSACTALLKAAEPRKSMTCNNTCNLHTHCCSASESGKGISRCTQSAALQEEADRSSSSGSNSEQQQLLTEITLVMLKLLKTILSVCGDAISIFCNTGLQHLSPCRPCCCNCLPACRVASMWTDRQSTYGLNEE